MHVSSVVKINIVLDELDDLVDKEVDALHIIGDHGVEMTAVIVDPITVRLYDGWKETMTSYLYKNGFVESISRYAGMTDSDFVNHVLVYAEDYDNNEHKRKEDYRTLVEAFEQRNG